MTGIAADQFFSTYADRAGDAYPKIEARPVKAGKYINIDEDGCPVDASIDEDGWQLEGAVKGYVTNEKFTAAFEKIDFIQKKRIDLPADAKVTEVQPGDIVEDDRHVFMAAEAGWLLEKDGKATYFSDISFRATFNTNAQPLDATLQFCKEKDAEATRYIVLPQDTTFAFKSGDYTVPAGHVLFVDADNEDGYTVTSKEDFSRKFVTTELAYSAAEAEFLRTIGTAKKDIKVPALKVKGKNPGA